MSHLDPLINRDDEGRYDLENHERSHDDKDKQESTCCQHPCESAKHFISSINFTKRTVGFALLALLGVIAIVRANLAVGVLQQQIDTLTSNFN